MWRHSERIAKWKISMRFGSAVKRAALLALTLNSVVCAQAPTPSSTPTSAPPSIEANFLLAAAKGGDPKAQFDLGNSYFNTRYVTLAYADALSWYRKSAAQGYAPAVKMQEVEEKLGMIQ